MSTGKEKSRRLSFSEQRSGSYDSFIDVSVNQTCSAAQILEKCPWPVMSLRLTVSDLRITSVTAVVPVVTQDDEYSSSWVTTGTTAVTDVIRRSEKSSEATSQAGPSSESGR